MAGPTVAADPAALRQAAASELDRSDRLARAAALLATIDPPLSRRLTAHRGRALSLLEWAGQVGAALADAGGAGPPTPSPIQFDPTGDGLVVEVFGDLGTARRVAVLVPGVGTTATNEPVTARVAGQHLFEAATALDPRTAVVVWLGYDAPGYLDAALDDAADVGGAALARFVGGLRLTQGAEVTVVGHSYGSLVTASALRRGMRVDEVVVAGSPGLGADEASDMPLRGAGLYALRAPFDPIPWTEVFGRDPSDPRFGAVRLDTGDGAGQPTGHSSYFEPGTESLANVAAVVAGRADLLHVVEPSAAERWIGDLDDQLRTARDPAIDGVQDGLDAANDMADAVLPFDRERHVALEEAQRLVDVAQRVASPDFVGDVAADAWDVLFG